MELEFSLLLVRRYLTRRDCVRDDDREAEAQEEAREQLHGGDEDGR